MVSDVPAPYGASAKTVERLVDIAPTGFVISISDEFFAGV
jgi:hypothetical protein